MEHLCNEQLPAPQPPRRLVQEEGTELEAAIKVQNEEQGGPVSLTSNRIC